MSLLTKKVPVADAVDIDLLLQDTYLLVVELRYGEKMRTNEALSTLCIAQVERVRLQLRDAGMSLRSIDLISHAQCALLDETVLAYADTDARAKWTHEPLQARFFNRHQAGVYLYEEMSEVIREAAPDPFVLTVYHRVLMLGFLGRYRTLEDPERQQMVTRLNAHVFPLKIHEGVPTHIGDGQRGTYLTWLGSPVLHVLAGALVLAATWWGFDYLLAKQISSLALGQVD
jgi:type VI secretion system protein ImpK